MIAERVIVDERVETNIDLYGQTISAAAARLTELAKQMDYQAVATGPRTFHLVRRRRQRMRVRTQSMTLTFVEDRAGPRLRVVGDVDIVLLEHLTGRSGDSLIRDATDIPIAHEPEFTPVFQAPVVQYELPRNGMRAVRPATPAVGMISAVPGAPTERVSVDGGPDLIVVNNSNETGVAGDRLSAATVKRDRVDPSAAATATITTADGTTRLFVRPMVIGRNPNPAVGPPGADVVAIADPSLSKSHCVMAMIDGELVVTDMHSLNGTSVEAHGQVQQLVPGQASRPVGLPAVVQAGEARLEVAMVGGGTT